jgi:hypothetical protein
MMTAVALVATRRIVACHGMMCGPSAALSVTEQKTYVLASYFGYCSMVYRLTDFLISANQRLAIQDDRRHLVVPVVFPGTIQGLD